jgi:hypothetical protein
LSPEWVVADDKLDAGDAAGFQPREKRAPDRSALAVDKVDCTIRRRPSDADPEYKIKG